MLTKENIKKNAFSCDFFLSLLLTCYLFLSGQFICGNKHCDGKDGLASYEVSVSKNISDLLNI